MTRVFCSHSVVNDLSAFRLPLNTAGRPATRVFHRPSIGSVGPPGSVRPLPICNSVSFRCDLGLLVSQGERAWQYAVDSQDERFSTSCFLFGFPNLSFRLTCLTMEY